MKIYPDPELPDIEVEWYTEDCGPDTPQVALTLVGVDDGTVEQQVVACDPLKITLKNVERKRYRVDGSLLLSDGSVVTTSSGEADLRNGINESVFLYFDSAPSFRVAWAFADGASCASLEADTMQIDFSDPMTGMYSFATSCISGAYVGDPYGGAFTVQLRAVSRGKTVAVSQMTPELQITPPDLTDAGTLTLAPCGAGCP